MHNYKVFKVFKDNKASQEIQVLLMLFRIHGLVAVKLVQLPVLRSLV